MDDAIRIGLENNFGVLIARNESQIAANNVTWGNAGLLPSININAAYDKAISSTDIKVVSGTELHESKAQTDWINAGVNLKWTLFDGLNMFIRYDRLKKMQDMGEVEFRKAVENTMANIIITYFDIVQQQMVRRVLEEQVALSQERVNIAETRKSVGSGSELDLLQAQVDLNGDASALFNQNASLANAKTGLNELLSRDASLYFQVIDTVILGPQLALDTLRKYTLQHNKDLLLLSMQKDAALLDMKSFKAERLPVINFNSGYNFLRNETQASFIQYNRQLGPHFGISADFNLFDGFNQHRKVQNAQIALLNSELQVQQIRNQLDAYLIRLNNDYQNDLQLIGFESDNLKLAIKNMDIAKESYSVGTISPIQLREVQKNLMSANNRLIYALYKAKVKETELLLLSGQLVK
jgi:outer membrane protein TolC